MRGPKPPEVTLSAEECRDLELLVRAHTTPQQVALRARIVLAAADGRNNTQIARQLGVEDDTVRLWRLRWLGMQAASLDDLPVADRLTDAPRPGAPARITPEQVCQVIALACEAPEKAGRPISQWTAHDCSRWRCGMWGSPRDSRSAPGPASSRRRAPAATCGSGTAFPRVRLGGPTPGADDPVDRIRMDVVPGAFGSTPDSGQHTRPGPYCPHCLGALSAVTRSPTL